MNVSGIATVSPLPKPTREEMIAVAAARPAVLQLQAVAVHAADRGTSGQGTPAVDPDAGIDFYA
jgi:hypothetical protein